MKNFGEYSADKNGKKAAGNLKNRKLYANYMQMNKIKKGLNLLKPLSSLGDRVRHLGELALE